METSGMPVGKRAAEGRFRRAIFVLPDPRLRKLYTKDVPTSHKIKYGLCSSLCDDSLSVLRAQEFQTEIRES